MRLTQKHWFWILQFFGWGIVAALNHGSKIILVPADKMNPMYFAFEGLIFFTFGIISSTLFRNYLKRVAILETQNTKNYLKVFGVFILATIWFSVCTLYLTDTVLELFKKEANSWGTLTTFSTIANLGIFLFFWTIFYVGIKSIIKARRSKIERLQLETSLKESQLNALKGQINPHFMFNSLNNIRGLMLEDVDKSREMLTRLSEMLRYSLNMNKVDAIALEEELEIVDNYIALSKIQFEDRLTFSKELDASLLTEKIPPMLLQMLVENAIKHGISNQKNGGEVFLKIYRVATTLCIELRNTGTLVDNKTSTKIGIQNIKRRLQLLYGNASDFSLTEKNNNVYAHVKIPLKADGKD